MGGLVRSLIIAGLISGTQPITLMGLLLVMTGKKPAHNGWAFIAGAFVVETTILLSASVVFGATVGQTSGLGRFFLAIRIVLGVALIAVGILYRRPPKNPPPPVPKALAKLQELTPGKAFGAGVVLADYQGPAVGSLAIAAADVGLSGRVAAVALYTLLGSGVPVLILVMTARSDRARGKLTRSTDWVMANRRMLTSWIALLMGLFLVGDAVLALATAA